MTAEHTSESGRVCTHDDTAGCVVRLVVHPDDRERAVAFVPSMTAHGSVVHHRSERGVWCRESRVFLGSGTDLSLHRCSAAADHQSADWSCTIKLVDLEVQP